MHDDKSAGKGRPLYANGEPARLVRPGETVQGILRNLDEGNLLLERPGEKVPIVVPRDLIAGVDVRQRRSQKGKGAGIGAAVGLGIGLAVGLASGSDGPGCFFLCYTAGQKAAMFSLLTVPLGTAIGAAAAPGAVWDRDVAVDRFRFRATTGGRGIGLSVSYGF